MKNTAFCFVVATGGMLAVLPATAMAQQKPLPPRKPDFSLKGAAAAPPRVIAAEIYEGKAVRVVDADTVEVERADKKVETVHLFGVRAPKTGEPMEADARAFVEKSVVNQRVRVEVQSRDKTGKAEANVFVLAQKPRYAVATPALRSSTLDPNDPAYSAALRPLPQTPPVSQAEPSVNVALLRAGLAKWDAAAAPQAQTLSDAQTGAQKDKTGVWK